MLFAVEYEVFAADPMTFRTMANLLHITGHGIVCVAGYWPESSGGRLASSVVGSAMPLVYAGDGDRVVAAAADGYVIDAVIQMGGSVT